MSAHRLYWVDRDAASASEPTVPKLDKFLNIDDLSTDNTIQIVESYVKNDSRIKLFKLEKNSGAGVARNSSIKHAKGRYIAFCDSDDQWKTTKLEKQIKFF